jgi:2-polyprenyl-3-methyl-5-hydroxy-6-metoxy-1,4-benzoquinol methylase
MNSHTTIAAALAGSEPQTPLHISHLPLISKTDWILKKVSGKSVLHVGPTDYPTAIELAQQGRLLHLKLQNQCKELIGVDLSQQSIDALRDQFGVTDIVFGDAEELDLVFPGRRFDVILAGDVIEHLSNLGRFLSSARKVLHPEGELIITTPNAFALKRMLGAILYRQERNHPDHLYYFSIMNLWQVAWRFGYVITEANTFMYENPHSALNRRGNMVTKLFMKLTSNNFLADELAVAMKPTPDR